MPTPSEITEKSVLERTVKETTLHYLGGSSDKIYRAWIENYGNQDEFVVGFAFGRRGSRLQVGTKTPDFVPLSRANLVYEKLVNSKIAKGYNVIGTQGHGESCDQAAKDAYRIPTHLYQNQPKANNDCLPLLLNSVTLEELNNLSENKNWVFQEKMDGKRMVVCVKSGEAKAYNKRGLEIGAPASILEEMEILAQGNDLTLDGECLSDCFHVFDILCHKTCLKSKPYSYRLECLEKLFGRFSGTTVQQLPTSKTKKEKSQLLEELKTSKKEGVVAKNINAIYTPGRPNSGGNYLKYKFVKTASAIVGGHNQKHSVSLCLLDGEKKVAIGNVTIPTSEDLPEIDSIIEVKYLYAMPSSNSLYQPSFIGKRDDVSAEECSIEQLEYKNS